MANRRSSIKKIRIDERRRERNVRVRSELRSILKKVHALIVQKKAAEADQEARTLFSKLDKAVKKGVLHPNSVSRRKSRIHSKIHALKIGR